MHLPILYQDQDLVIINKPFGLLVHRTMLDKTETLYALQVLRDQIGQHVYPVHRLDKPTSGALIFALSPEMARLMSLEISEHRFYKKYLAIVRGTPLAEYRVDYPLTQKLDKIADKKAQKNKPPQEAITLIKKISSIELPIMVDRYPTSQYSLVEAVPKTGRKHQIRRHLKHINHPIIGDVEYGSTKHNRFFEDKFNGRRLYLACTEVSFKHPGTQLQMSVQAPLCMKFQNTLNVLRLKS